MAISGLHITSNYILYACTLTSFFKAVTLQFSNISYTLATLNHRDRDHHTKNIIYINLLVMDTEATDFIFYFSHND